MTARKGGRRPSLRAEMREIVERGVALGVALNWELIWGSVTREVAAKRIQTELYLGLRAGQFAQATPPAGLFDARTQHVYKPGPNPVKVTRAGHAEGDGLMGFMEYGRLMAAREKARAAWAAAKAAA